MFLLKVTIEMIIDDAKNLLLGALNKLEQLAEKALMQKKAALANAQELLEANQVLMHEIAKMQRMNAALSQEIKEKASNIKTQQELSIDQNTSCDVDFSIQQLKAILNRSKINEN